jgi:hypothetical protein
MTRTALVLVLTSFVLFAAAAKAGAPPYPIALVSVPDWRETKVTSYPTPGAVALTARVTGRVLVVAQAISKEPLSPQSATLQAYDLLFTRNAKHLPRGNLYVVVVVSGPQASSDIFSQYAYVFARGADGRWEPRPVAQRELSAVLSAMGLKKTARASQRRTGGSFLHGECLGLDGYWVPIVSLALFNR